MSEPIVMTIANSEEWEAVEYGSVVSAIRKNKHSSKLTPNLVYNVTGLDPLALYTPSLIIERANEYRYRLVNGCWERGKEEPSKQPKVQWVAHYAQGVSGAYWMDQNIDFSWIEFAYREFAGKHFRLECRRLYRTKLVLYRQDSGVPVHEFSSPMQVFVAGNAKKRNSQSKSEHETDTRYDCPQGDITGETGSPQRTSEDTSSSVFTLPNSLTVEKAKQIIDMIRSVGSAVPSDFSFNPLSAAAALPSTLSIGEQLADAPRALEFTEVTTVSFIPPPEQSGRERKGSHGEMEHSESSELSQGAPFQPLASPIFTPNPLPPWNSESTPDLFKQSIMSNAAFPFEPPVTSRAFTLPFPPPTRALETAPFQGPFGSGTRPYFPIPPPFMTFNGFPGQGPETDGDQNSNQLN